MLDVSKYGIPETAWVKIWKCDVNWNGAGGDKVSGCVAEKCDKPPSPKQLKGPPHSTQHHSQSVFYYTLQKPPFLLHTPKVYFKRSFTSCISVGRVYFVACVCPRQTVVSLFMGHSVAAACNARIMKRRHRIC